MRSDRPRLTCSVVLLDANAAGTYGVSYTPTKSGNYEAGVKLAKSGGLTGQYFENVWFFYTPVKTTVNPTIDLDWGLREVTDTGKDFVSIRWSGKVKPLYPETHTFFVSSDDGAKLWVDNVVLIDRWDSSCNETSATIGLKPHVFYNIKLEYKEMTGTAFVRLSWASQSNPKEIVPASQLYYETHVKQSPFSFIVSPNAAVGANSWAAGEGLALATAGTSAQLTIQANDMYDNERGEGGDLFSVRVVPPGGLASASTTGGGRPVHAVVVDEGDSSYIAEYTQYVAGNNTLYATLLTQGGVSATYYDNKDFTLPVKYRWAGFVAPVTDGEYTFTMDAVDSFKKDRMRLWVDNKLIIDQWTSKRDTVDPSGTIDLRSSYYYDLAVDYKIESDGATQTDTAVLKWEYGGLSAAVVPSTNLLVGQNVRDTPATVVVHPAGTCASTSFTTPNQDANGHSLELATAGLQSEFTITAKDLYNNLRCVGAEKFKVRLTGVDSLAGVVEDLSATTPGAYRVLYTATKSGTYDVAVVFGASGVQNSPFRLTVQPARRHLINSPATGAALTLSTAGVLSSVTITVRDRHENYQPNPSVADAGIQFTAAATVPPYNLTDTMDNPRLVLRYTITKSGSYSLRIGGSTASHESAVMASPFALNIYPSPPCSVGRVGTVLERPLAREWGLF